MKTTATLLTLALTASTALGGLLDKKSSITSVTVKGNAFFAGSSRFYIRGVDYQPGGSSNVADPIADSTSCLRDITEFQKLGINTVRVYTVDNTANHDTCMNALAAAGIYLVLDVNTPKYSINRANPSPSYNAVYLQSIFATIDAFAKYPNTLAFFSANEVINDAPTSACAPYVKAVTRDMRNYIKARSYRAIPVGYSAADISFNRLEMAEYMNCGTSDERSDFFAFNDYSWCDPSSFTQSGWDQKVKNFTGYGLPLFLSEYGCNTNTRDFGEVTSLYSTSMTPVYSGGLVYEYSQEASNYGLVQINSNSSVTELKDFSTLEAKFKATANPSGDGGYNSTGGASGCPAYSPPNWLVQDNTLPSMPSGAQQYMTSGAGTGPGLTGAGSQNSGPSATTTSSGTASATATKKSEAGSVRPVEWSVAPLVCGAVVLVSSFFGASLL